MERGILILSLFLIGLLIISGCEQDMFSGFAAYTDPSESSRKSPHQRSVPSGGNGEEGGLKCEDYVYSTCPTSECTRICFTGYEEYPTTTQAFVDIKLFDCLDIPGSCLTPGQVGPDVDDEEVFCYYGECGTLVDVDGDGYCRVYDEAVEGYPCDEETLGGEYTELQIDCNDDDPNIFPGQLEICNTKDDDCDGMIDYWDTDSNLYRDCVNGCFSEFDCEGSCLNWIGDGTCDAGEPPFGYGLNFYCNDNYDAYNTYNWDGGDCGGYCGDGECNTPYEFTMCEGDCIDDGYYEEEDELTCEDAGYLEDCASPIPNCYSPEGGVEDWIGDGYCDDGSVWSIDFYCSAYNYDDGDCECTDVGDCIYIDNAVDCLVDQTELSLNHKCQYEDCNGDEFTDTYVFTSISEDGPELSSGSINGLTDVTAAGIFIPEITSKNRPDFSMPTSTPPPSYSTNLDLLGNGICDEGQGYEYGGNNDMLAYSNLNFNCEEWNYDEGDCLNNIIAEDGDESEVITPSVEDSEYNQDLIDLNELITGEYIPPMETLFSAMKQIIEKIVDGSVVSYESPLEIYSFRGILVGETDFLRFDTLFFNVNGFDKGRVVDKTLYLDSNYLTEIYGELEQEIHEIKLVDLYETQASFKLSSEDVYASLKVGEEKFFDLNGDSIYDINLLLESIEESVVGLKVSVIFPSLSTDLSDIAFLSKEQTVYSEQSPEEFLRFIVSFVMILVMLIASFLLIKKAISLTEKNE